MKNLIAFVLVASVFGCAGSSSEVVHYDVSHNHLSNNGRNYYHADGHFDHSHSTSPVADHR